MSVLAAVKAGFLPFVALLSVVGAAMSTPGDPVVASEDRPNIVVVMTDDQTLEQLRVMSFTKSYFEQNGVTFDDFVTSFAVCCPSRATFLTGQYALHHGVLDNGPPRGGYAALDDSNTVPVWLQDAGYRTTFIGKYLNGYHTLDIPAGWSDWQALLNNKYYDFSLNDNGIRVKYGDQPADYQTDVLADRAVAAIHESAASADPFFLSIAVHAPHNNTGAIPPPAPRHAGTFADEALPQGPAFNEDDVSDKPAYIQGQAPLSQAVIDEITAYYRAELETLLSVDDLVNRVVTTLTDLRLTKQTVLFFTSDNGKMHGEHRISDRKSVPYEESNHVPLLVAGPGFPAGVRVSEQTANVDLAPTIVGLAGATAGLPMDGIDLRDVVATPEAHQDRAVLIERYDDDCFEGVRTPTNAYMRYVTGEEELYDLVSDRAQTQSLHNDPAWASAKADLSARLDALLAGGFEPCGRPSPAVSIGDATVSEARQGSVSVSVPLTLNVRNEAITVSYTLRPDSAGALDFMEASGSVKMAKGRLVHSIPVMIRSDSLNEADEALDVVITSVTPSIGINRAVGTVVIRNAGGSSLSGLSVGDVALVEGDDPVGASDVVYITVSLSKRLTDPLVIDYQTADGTALAGSDYQGAAGVVTIPAGSSSAKIPLAVINDESDESDQEFFVNVSTDSPLVTVRQVVGTITIFDDDSE